jgi:hypothetical protein
MSVLAGYDDRLSFLDWWEELNRELSCRGLEHVGLGVARELYKQGDFRGWADQCADSLARDADHKAMVSKAGTHAPRVCNKNAGSAQYAFRNWSHAYECPTCFRTGRFNKNFLGQRKVVCDGLKFTKESV